MRFTAKSYLLTSAATLLVPNAAFAKQQAATQKAVGAWREKRAYSVSPVDVLRNRKTIPANEQSRRSGVRRPEDQMRGDS